MGGPCSFPITSCSNSPDRVTCVTVSPASCRRWSIRQDEGSPHPPGGRPRPGPLSRRRHTKAPRDLNAGGFVLPGSGRVGDDWEMIKEIEPERPQVSASYREIPLAETSDRTAPSTRRFSRMRRQKTQADQHNHHHTQSHSVVDERHERLGGDELHEQRHINRSSPALTCAFIHPTRSTGRGVGETGSQSAGRDTTNRSQRACKAAMMRFSIGTVTLL